MSTRLPPTPQACDPGSHCTTCADEGTPMRVVRMDADNALAVGVDSEGREAEIQLNLVGAAAPGQLLLVHAGVALLRLDGGAGAGGGEERPR
ncbi:MAG TPA: HypC/HybG/HupF family hydrogenase formation chaperone [Gemmatimonadales bacterium]|nr:HypC/HybG/HupF family hydrogenase formation chaperone [Gemmatimonadales bacterium]